MVANSKMNFNVSLHHQILIKVCITPFLKTQLVDVEIPCNRFVTHGNFGLMVSMMVWVLIDYKNCLLNSNGC
jgi:hypothetical protein